MCNAECGGRMHTGVVLSCNAGGTGRRNAMTVSAGVTTYETSGEREFRMTRVVDAPRALVFDAWTNPRHLPQWLLGPEGWTMSVCEIDFHVGGAWRMVWDRGPGQELALTGKYLEIVVPERVVSTERSGAERPEPIHTVAFTQSVRRPPLTSPPPFPPPHPPPPGPGT